MSNLKLPPYQKQQRRSYAGFSQSQSSNFASSFQLLVTAPTSTNSSSAKMATDSKIPSGYETMNDQVAGHVVQVGSDEVGMLKCVDDGSVLKPGGSAMCAAREIKFYEQLLTSTDPNILPLREFTPEYRGTKTLTVGTKTITFIKLQDLTYGMLEPCVIDIKMGQRTWDPLATDKKREAESGKYKQCKETVGFCIPGFQTYSIVSGGFKKFGRDYGKKLNQDTVKDAFRIFLNADSGLNRQLITSILTNLWAIQKWMKSQTVFQFFSTSILIVYDARKLRKILETQKRQSASLNNSMNMLEISNGGGNSPTGNSSGGSFGDLPVASGNKRNSGSFGEAMNELTKPPPKAVYKKIQRSHSSTNNFETEIRCMKKDYQQMLDHLVGAYDEKKQWIQVKMIDFAHTFNTSESTDVPANGLDLNYLNAIDHLVEIMEEFLRKCD